MNPPDQVNSRQARALSIWGAVVSWSVTVLVALFCVSAGFRLVLAIPSFENLFQGLGVELPWPSRFLILTYRWLLPLTLGVIGGFTVSVQLFGRRLRWKLVTCGGAMLLALVVTIAVRYALYLPFQVVIKKLSEAR